jgi:hypothetical protein
MNSSSSWALRLGNGDGFGIAGAGLGFAGWARAVTATGNTQQGGSSEDSIEVQQRRRGSVRLGQSKKEAATKIDGSDVGVGGARRTGRRPGVKMPTVWACGDAAE